MILLFCFLLLFSYSLCLKKQYAAISCSSSSTIIAYKFLFTGGGSSNHHNGGTKNKLVGSHSSQGRASISNDDYGDDDSDSDGSDEYGEDGKKRKRSRGQQRHMTEEQKVERRSVRVILFSFF